MSPVEHLEDMQPYQRELFVRAVLREMRKRGWDSKVLQFCYDFPTIVLHVPTCKRYERGGVCRPLPTPRAPFTDDEKSAIYRYMTVMAGDPDHELGQMEEVEALGVTVYVEDSTSDTVN